jgi:hypothetical protein
MWYDECREIKESLPSECSVSWRMQQKVECLFFLQIEDGEIFATINQKDGMVIFHDDPEKYNSPVMLRQLEEEVS